MRRIRHHSHSSLAEIPQANCRHCVPFCGFSFWAAVFSAELGLRRYFKQDPVANACICNGCSFTRRDVDVLGKLRSSIIPPDMHRDTRWFSCRRDAHQSEPQYIIVRPCPGTVRERRSIEATDTRSRRSICPQKDGLACVWCSLHFISVCFSAGVRTRTFFRGLGLVLCSFFKPKGSGRIQGSDDRTKKCRSLDSNAAWCGMNSMYSLLLPP